MYCNIIYVNRRKDSIAIHDFFDNVLQIFIELIFMLDIYIY